MSAHVDHEANLRAALRAAAESLEPRADGLEHIRARLRQPRPVYVAWAQAASAEIVLRASTWLQDAVYQSADWLQDAVHQVTDWLRLAYERFAPAQAPGRHRSRTQGLLRPLAAMAVVMFIVAAGTYVAIDASTAIFPSSSNSQPGGAPGTGGHSRGAAPGASHTSSSQGPAGTGSRSAAPPSCKPTSPKPGTTSTAPPPAQSANPSPTPSDTSTSTDTSAPSPSSATTPPASAAPSASANPPTQPANSPSPGLQPKPSPSC